MNPMNADKKPTEMAMRAAKSLNSAGYLGAGHSHAEITEVIDREYAPLIQAATETVEAFKMYQTARFDPSDHTEIRRINAVNTLRSFVPALSQSQGGAGA